MTYRYEPPNYSQIDLETALERIRQLEELSGVNFQTHPKYRLTTYEQVLLGMLCSHDTVISKEHAYTVMYGMRNDPPHMKIFDVYACKLRRKLRPLGIDFITVWGRGWYMEPEDRQKALALRFAHTPETSTVSA